MKIIDKIKSPADLKELDLQQLDQLSAEIREEMIEKVSKTGGHIAPSLGVVELTLSLHRVFNSPKDKFIWDVGHQSYVHKMITGRRDKFNTLRQYQGISGFPKRKESPHDTFDTGHSSTSISAALGIALARDLNKENYHVLAIIGDGALTGGMAFEALNHAGHLGTKIIVILNDNEMSIVENVGALSGYLSRMRTDPKYYKGKEDLEFVLKKLPLGNRVLKAAERIKDSFKYLVVPGMLFEELGFTYLGPIDGHNIVEMKEVLEHAKIADGPVVVHVITKKGKGYKPAEDNPDKFHGVGPFDIKTGETLASKVRTYTQVFGETLNELASENDKIVAISAAMPSGTGLTSYAQKFPKRFFDVGIAEQHAVTMAAGLACQGFKPVVAIYSTFLQRAYDQILHDVALQKLPVVFAIDRAGLVGEDGETHQGVFDYSYLRHIPNMVLMAPKDENELRGMLKTAVNYKDGPIAIRYPRGAGEGVTLSEKYDELPIGVAEVLKEGKDVTILAIGNTVYNCLKAADELAKQGIDATVINSRFIKPLDKDIIIKYAKKTKKVVTVEEQILQGGFGSAVMELLESNNIKVLVHRIGIPDEFVCQGSTSIQRDIYGLTPDKIAQFVLKELEK